MYSIGFIQEWELETVKNIFFNIDEALNYARLMEKNMPEDATRQMLAPSMYYEFMDNPYSSFENNTTDDKFIVCRLGTGRYSLKPNLKGHRFLYRGQVKYYKDCAPSIFRDRRRQHFIEEMVRVQEEQLLMLSHPLVRLLDSGVELADQQFIFEMNLYGLSQHYYNKTSFIDLSSDYNVATFFVTNKYNSTNDTYSPVGEGIGCLYLYELREGIDFKGTPLSTIGLQVFPRSGIQRCFLYAMKKGEDFNDLDNLILLKFRQHKSFSDKYNKMFAGGKALFPDDILTHHWQTYNKEPKVVSKKAVEFNVRWNNGETYDSVSSKLKDRGFSIVDYHPSFTDEELHDYYYSFPDFWEKFCAKIYFPGSNGESLHKTSQYQESATIPVGL